METRRKKYNINDPKKIGNSENIKITSDDTPISYIDTKKYIEEVFKTKRPDDILKLLRDNPYYIVDTDIIDFKLSQLFQLNNIIPVAVTIFDEPSKLTKTPKVKTWNIELNFSKYYYNLDEKKIYKSAENDRLEIVGLIFFDILQKPILDSRFQRNDFQKKFDLGEKKLEKLDVMKITDLSFSANDIDSKIFYFSDLDQNKFVERLDKLINLSNYLLETRDVRLRLRTEIETSVLSNITDFSIGKVSGNQEIYNLFSLFDYFRLDTKLLFEQNNSRKDALSTIEKKMETKRHNYLETIREISERDRINYYRSLCKTAYIRKFGIQQYKNLPILKTVESTLNTYPIIPDILPLLTPKIAKIIAGEADIIVQNNLIDATIYSKNRKIILLANLVKTEKFPDQQWRKFKELTMQLGLSMEKPFGKDTNWLMIDGIKLLCRHYYVSMISAKKQLTEEETHKKLLEFVESDSTEYCKICNEKLTYRDKFEGLVSTYEAESFNTSYDETFRLIQRTANIWVHGYLVNTYQNNNYAVQAISKNIANILYDFLKPTHDKLLNQKNKDPILVMKKFNIYINTYVGAAIIKIVEDNSRTLGLYGIENITQNSLVEGVFRIIKKIIGDDIYIFEDISEAKVEQGIKNAYKTLNDTISKIQYKSEIKELDYNPYKDMLTSLNKTNPIPEDISQLVAIVTYTLKNNILYNPITVPSHDKLSIQYSEAYTQYLKFVHNLSSNNDPNDSGSFRYWATSTLLVKHILRQSYEYDNYVNSSNTKENLNLIYGITQNYANLKKISDVVISKLNLHKHSWSIPVWGKKNLKWNGVISDPSIVFGKNETANQNLVYIDTICSICGKSLRYPGDDDMTAALAHQNEIENFYRYFRFNCPKDGTNHSFVYVKDTQKCKKCGLELSYIPGKNEEYYEKYHGVYLRETKKKQISFNLNKSVKPIGSKSVRKSELLKVESSKVDPKFSHRLAEELSERMIQDKNKRQILLTKLDKLGNTEGILYNAKDLADPNRSVRGLALEYYLLKIIGIISMAKRSELRDIVVPKINDIVNIGIKYEKFPEPLMQYDNIINILGKINKIDNKFALYIADNLFLSDQHNSKLEKNKEAEIQSNINFEQADQSFIDLDNTDSDITDFNADNMFSYENMDYDGHNDDK